jgi:hypothetical protein
MFGMTRWVADGSAIFEVAHKPLVSLVIFAIELDCMQVSQRLAMLSSSLDETASAKY